jgi:hypothetical protein
VDGFELPAVAPACADHVLLDVAVLPDDMQTAIAVVATPATTRLLRLRRLRRGDMREGCIMGWSTEIRTGLGMGNQT